VAINGATGTQRLGHKATVREEFTRQADAYASSAVIMNEARLERLVSALGLSGSERALEVATIRTVTFPPVGQECEGIFRPCNYLLLTVGSSVLNLNSRNWEAV
jgi:hypothetical protein